MESLTRSAKASPSMASLTITRKNPGYALLSLRPGADEVGEMWGMPYDDRMALAPIDAPEHRAPTTSSIPSSTASWAAVSAARPSHAVSYSSKEKL